MTTVMKLGPARTGEPPSASRPDAGPELSSSRLYRVGGLAAFAFILLTAVSVVATVVTAYPSPQAGTLPDATATLGYIRDNRTAFVFDQILIQVPFTLTAATFMALYAALKDLGRTAAAMGVLLAIGSMIASLIYLTIAFALVLLSDQAVAATTESQRAAVTSAAMGLIALYNAPSLTAVLWPAGILAISIPMLGGVFHRTVAYLGILTGAAGMAAEAARPIIGSAYGVYGALLLAWTLAVAWKLHRLGRSPAAAHAPGTRAE